MLRQENHQRHSHAPPPSPPEASSVAGINTCPAAMAGTGRRNAHMLPAPKKTGNYGTTQVRAAGAALRAPVQSPAPRHNLVSQLWLCPAKSSKCPKTNCTLGLGLFNTWELILDTLMNSRNDRRICKPTSSWIKHRIRNSYHENIFRPR